MKLSILLLRLIIAVTVVVLCTVLLLWVWLRPAPTEWSLRLHATPLTFSVSVRKLVALATQPVVARLVARHSLRTATGTWRIEVQPTGAVDWRAAHACSRCTPSVPPLCD